MFPYINIYNILDVDIMQIVALKAVCGQISCLPELICFVRYSISTFYVMLIFIKI